ncbi:MAG TPA: GerMN domain-containing protein [Candidatus Acidoferrales bacterium]|nr:GerMN domain-containing protein [Candidatus Acidoferrales bacterium]
MPRGAKIALGLLVVAVIIGLISFRGIQRRVKHLAELQTADEKARHEILAAPITTSSDVTQAAKIYWAAGPDRVAPVEVPLPLSANPVERCRQLLHELTVNPPTPGQRTIPADTTVMGFYILPDGTAIADFSDALSSEMPSGILSEAMAVDSIAQTLESNVPTLHRLKILIHGQEVDTLAGNLDLTGFFDLNPPSPPAPPVTSAKPAR